MGNLKEKLQQTQLTKTCKISPSTQWGKISRPSRDQQVTIVKEKLGTKMKLTSLVTKQPNSLALEEDIQINLTMTMSRHKHRSLAWWIDQEALAAASRTLNYWRVFKTRQSHILKSLAYSEEALVHQLKWVPRQVHISQHQILTNLISNYVTNHQVRWWRIVSRDNFKTFQTSTLRTMNPAQSANLLLNTLKPVT